MSDKSREHHSGDVLKIIIWASGGLLDPPPLLCEFALVFLRACRTLRNQKKNERDFPKFKFGPSSLNGYFSSFLTYEFALAFLRALRTLRNYKKRQKLFFSKVKFGPSSHPQRLVFWGVVQKTYGGYSETTQTRSFRLFALLTSQPRGKWNYLGGVKVSGTHHDGNIFYFQIYKHMHFLSGVTIGLKTMVSGLNHPL